MTGFGLAGGTDGDSGIGDFGAKGMKSFVDDHQCTDICRALTLESSYALVMPDGEDEEQDESDPEDEYLSRYSHFSEATLDTFFAHSKSGPVKCIEAPYCQQYFGGPSDAFLSCAHFFGGHSRYILDFIPFHTLTALVMPDDEDEEKDSGLSQFVGYRSRDVILLSVQNRIFQIPHAARAIAKYPAQHGIDSAIRAQRVCTGVKHRYLFHFHG
ncbi:hypothetical protein B0H14DRAFT_2556149 [Mycena olivaceomarginata]|nr:hypothetical protein B0H14DRAFT_2556149 [Mycena olivaceomarginata]